MTRPWYRRFPDNFIAGTAGLTLEEKGAYSLVLDLMYVRGGPIPDEPRYIAGVCNCSVRKWNAIRARLIQVGKITVVDGCLMNARAEKELENAAKDARELAENGAKGGNKTAENRTASSKTNSLGAAPVQHARATQLQYQDSVLEKAENGLEEPATEPLVDVNKYVDTQLYAACVALSPEKVPKFLDHKLFPLSLVTQAQAAIAAQPTSDEVH
ncbi:MAG: hypothetical protein JWR51_4645 [Devosia sp.]|uniref:YdaU family protein n=1 Tax=Devosia sp. TaxID=1871048 RepID=UPI00261EDFCC|nr:YdaU family protein [Devosia sp.]MDB5531542.1 hypothetical protein [Devosia sp.]